VELFLLPRLERRRAGARRAAAVKPCALSQDETRAPGGAALLTVPVREQRAFLCDAINVRRLVAHHSLVVSADVPIADVVAPDDEDVGLLVLRVPIGSRK